MSDRFNTAIAPSSFSAAGDSGPTAGRLDRPADCVPGGRGDVHIDVMDIARVIYEHANRKHLINAVSTRMDINVLRAAGRHLEKREPARKSGHDHHLNHGAIVMGASLEVIEVPIELISIPEKRKKSFLKKTKADKDLLQSLKMCKQLINPINVRKIPDSDRYELVIGRRRFWAAQTLAWQTVPCKVETWADEQLDFLRTVENVHRTQMTPIQTVRAHQQLMVEWNRRFGQDPGKKVSGKAGSKKVGRGGGGKFTPQTTTNGSPQPLTATLPLAVDEALEAPDAEPPVRSFSAMLQEATGKSERLARDNMLIAKNINPDDLMALESCDVTRADLLKIAKIDDPSGRKLVMSEIAGGRSLEDAIKSVASTPDIVARDKEMTKEAALSDEDWLTVYKCREFAQGLQDPTKYFRDALLYRFTRDHRSVLRGKCRKRVIEDKLKGWTRVVSWMGRVMFMEHPKDWMYCPNCDGKNVDLPECIECQGSGYNVRVEWPKK
jgi:hypothetical protein